MSGRATRSRSTSRRRASTQPAANPDTSSDAQNAGAPAEQRSTGAAGAGGMGSDESDSDWDPEQQSAAAGEEDDEGGEDEEEEEGEDDEDAEHVHGAGDAARIFSQILRQIGGDGSMLDAGNIQAVLQGLAEQGLLHQDEDGNLIMLAGDDEEEEEGEEDGDAPALESVGESEMADAGDDAHAEPVEKDDEALAEYAEYTRLDRARQQPRNVMRALQAHQVTHSTRPAASSELAALAATHIPSICTSTERFDGRAFCGKFSHALDGTSSRFATATQDGVIHLFETDRWKLYKQIEARDIGWSIVDIDFSGDARFVIYSSWSHSVHLINTQGEYELHEALDFEPGAAAHVCMFGIRFSTNGSREILAGLNNGVAMLYDVERKRKIWGALAHDDDINSVCWLDDSGNLFATGSDDTTIRIWDRRLLGSGDDGSSAAPRRSRYAAATPVGGFAGHVQGLTCVTAMPDGNARYMLSNSKDQSMKLWDLRRLMSADALTAATNERSSHHSLDYRWQRPSRREMAASAAAARRANLDNSVLTCTGHAVSQTLIRCDFSPQHTTGFRYLFTGSSDGAVWVYDSLTGENVKRLQGHQGIVRDVSWHDHLIVSSSWDHSVRRWGLHQENLADNDAIRIARQSQSRRMGRGLRRYVEDDDE